MPSSASPRSWNPGCSARSAPTSTTNIAATFTHSGQYLLDVINDILDMSKIEAGRIKLDLEDVELDPSPGRRDARRHGARAGQAPQGHLADRRRASSFKADRRAVKQIALNLLSNAVKFTPDDGDITVRGRLSRDAVVDRHPGYRHRHPARRAARSSAGRSSRSKASSPRPITAPAWASPSPNRWSSCTAARCAFSRGSAPARSSWCASRSTARPDQDKGVKKLVA